MCLRLASESIATPAACQCGQQCGVEAHAALATADIVCVVLGEPHPVATSYTIIQSLEAKYYAEVLWSVEVVLDCCTAIALGSGCELGFGLGASTLKAYQVTWLV